MSFPAPVEFHAARLRRVAEAHHHRADQFDGSLRVRLRTRAVALEMQADRLVLVELLRWEGCR